MSQLDLGGQLVAPIPMGGDSGDGEHIGEAQASPGGRSAMRPEARQQLDPGLGLEPAAFADVEMEDAQGGDAAEPPAKQRLKFAQRDGLLMAHARQAKSLKQQGRAMESLSQKLKDTTRVVDMVAGLMPGVASLIARSATAIGRMKKNLCATHFVLLARAACMGAKANISIGIKFKRLVCVAARLVLLRQALAMDFILRSCQASLEPESSGEERTKAVHLAYIHLWDETQVRAKARRAQKFRKTGLGTSMETMSQRGAIGLCMINAQTGESVFFDETWLCRPYTVSGTPAASLFPALDKNMLNCLRIDNDDSLRALSLAVSSFSFLPICDKASGNLSILRHFVRRLKMMFELYRITNLLILPDVCGVHNHHRGKLSLKGLRTHTMRHFSIAHLYRLEPVQRRMIERVEQLVSAAVKRRVGPPSGNFISLRAVIDVLFDLEAPHHKRGPSGDKHSQRYTDLVTLADIINGDICGPWTHWCWNSSESKPCCASQTECVEKSVVVVVNALFGQSDPIPAESRWTSVLANFKQTLLRKLVYSVGVDCFDLVSASEAAAGDDRVEVDAEAVEATFQHLKHTRISKAAAYYNDPNTFFELGLFAALLDIYDSLLLYPMLGDPIGKSSGGGACQLDKLMDKTQSAVGQCMDKFLVLLRSWRTTGVGRKYLLILDALAAPMADQNYMRWSRSQVLRLSPSVFRRYEVKYSAFPYRLRALYADPGSVANTALVEELLNTDEADLDPYSVGLRKRFPSRDLLLSPTCRETIHTDFSSHTYSVDLVERLHSDVTHNITKRTGGKNFANLSREALLRQACVVHTARGGQHPQKATEKKRPPPVVEEVLMPKVLNEFHESITDGSAFARSAQPALEVAGEIGHASSSGHQEPCAASAGSANAPLVPHDQSLGQLITVRRPCQDSLASTGTSAAPGTKGPRVGLSPKVLELNKRMHAAKELKGSRLTQQEVTAVRAEFDDFWASLPETASYVEAYQDWRETRASEPERMCAFQPSWGGGSYFSPISSEEFFHYHARHGWPADREVFDKDGTDSAIEPDDPNKFLDSASTRLWSFGASARNVSRRSVPSEQQFTIVERGLANAIEGVGREAAEAGC